MWGKKGNMPWCGGAHILSTLGELSIQLICITGARVLVDRIHTSCTLRWRDASSAIHAICITSEPVLLECLVAAQAQRVPAE